MKKLLISAIVTISIFTGCTNQPQNSNNNCNCDRGIDCLSIAVDFQKKSNNQYNVNNNLMKKYMMKASKCYDKAITLNSNLKTEYKVTCNRLEFDISLIKNTK